MPSTAPSQSGVSSPVSFVTASSEKLMLDEPALRTRRPCHAYSGLRSRWRSSSQGDEENQLQRVPVPSGNHPAGDLALRPVYPELSRRRRFVGGTGIMVSYETVRRWVNHFGPMIAANLRKRRPKPYTTW